MAHQNKGDLMKQAEQIWGMLDEMSVKDPSGYAKFIEENKKQAKESMSKPKPYLLIRTHIQEPCKGVLFINFVSWIKIPKPKTDADPISVAGSRMDQTEQYSVVSVAFHPEVLDECNTKTQEMDMLVNLALNYVEDQNSLKVSRNYTHCPEKFKGEDTDLWRSFMGDKVHEDNDLLDNPEKLLKQMGKISEDSDITLEANGLPDIMMGPGDVKQPKKKGLIEEISNQPVGGLRKPEYDISVKEEGGSKPRRLLLKVNLDGVTSVSECELDITEVDISLKVDAKYELFVRLPEKILEEQATAKFNTKTSSLALTMPTALNHKPQSP